MQAADKPGCNTCGRAAGSGVGVPRAGKVPMAASNLIFLLSFTRREGGGGKHSRVGQHLSTAP